MKNNENTDRVILKREIYSIEAVKKAVADYQGLANIQIFEYEEEMVCQFRNCVYDITLTEMEFENYLIGLCNQKGDWNESL